MAVSGEEAVEDDESRRWAEMIPEILATIFLRIPIPVDEMVRTVPFVCKGWMKAVVGPWCWSEIDISEWCLRRTDNEAVDNAVITLVGRSKSTFRRLSAYRLGNSSFTFMANRGRCLTVLQIPMSNITDDVALKYSKYLSNLKELDISGCSLLTVKGLEAFGNHCKSLVCLKRYMNPMLLKRSDPQSYITDTSDDSEAICIANTMLNLQHLELSYGPFSDVGLSEIIANCGRCLTVLQIPLNNITDNVVLNHSKSLPNLKELDISGCSRLTVKGLEAFGKECKSLVCLIRNMVPDMLSHTFEIYMPFTTIDDSEAKMIAKTMPNLRHLELCYSPISQVGLSEILTKCESLSRLDIEGSWLVRLEGPFQRISYNGLWKPFITKTLIDSYYGRSYQ